jgi:hypothetical protein
VILFWVVFLRRVCHCFQLSVRPLAISIKGNRNCRESSYGSDQCSWVTMAIQRFKLQSSGVVYLGTKPSFWHEPSGSRWEEYIKHFFLHVNRKQIQNIYLIIPTWPVLLPDLRANFPFSCRIRPRVQASWASFAAFSTL